MESITKVLSKDPVSAELEKLNFDIIHIGYLKDPKDRTSPTTLMNNFKLLILIKGKANIHLGDDVRYLQEGDCVIFGPGALYYAEFIGEEEGTLVSICFNPSTVAQTKLFTDMLGLKDILLYPHLIEPPVIQHILSIYKDAIDEIPGGYYRLQLMLKRVISSITYGDLSTIIQGYQKQGNSSEEKIVLKCHNYLMNNPNLKVTVDDLCKVCNVSQSYLYKCFKNILGISTKDYIIDAKIDIAQKLLVQSNKSITAIAYETGFNNAYHFSNVFKAECGVSPSTFRKNKR